MDEQRLPSGGAETGLVVLEPLPNGDLRTVAYDRGVLLGIEVKRGSW
jgi:hypothetical protein